MAGSCVDRRTSEEAQVTFFSREKRKKCWIKVFFFCLVGWVESKRRRDWRFRERLLRQRQVKHRSFTQTVKCSGLRHQDAPHQSLLLDPFHPTRGWPNGDILGTNNVRKAKHWRLFSFFLYVFFSPFFAGADVILKWCFRNIIYSDELKVSGLKWLSYNGYGRLRCGSILGTENCRSVMLFDNLIHQTRLVSVFSHLQITSTLGAILLLNTIL